MPRTRRTILLLNAAVALGCYDDHGVHTRAAATDYDGNAARAPGEAPLDDAACTRAVGMTAMHMEQGDS